MHKAFELIKGQATGAICHRHVNKSCRSSRQHAWLHYHMTCCCHVWLIGSPTSNSNYTRKIIVSSGL